MKKIFGKKFAIALVIVLIAVSFFGIRDYIKSSQVKGFNNSFYNWLLNSTTVNAEENNDTFKAPLKYNNESVPVLMYHSISDSKFNPYILSKDRFEQQMDYLKTNGFTTLSTEDVYEFMMFNKPIPKKSVLITFDDGYMDNYKYAYPILKKDHFKATFFVITGNIDKGDLYLSSAQLKEMEQNGIDIESHTVHHDKLGTLSYSEQLQTLKDSKQYLENTLNKKVNFIAYPFGSYNMDTLKADKEAGYTMAFTTEGKWSNKANGILTLHRVFISGFCHMGSFERRVNGQSYLFKNFYIY